MAIEVFNRYENKYMMDEKIFVRFKARLADQMEPDPYNIENETYAISNLYYDTNDNHLIRTSLQGPKYKEKLRLRAYGVPDMDSQVFLEIKKKVDGLVNKRRSPLSLSDAYAFVETGAPPMNSPFVNRQVLQEIDYLLRTQPLSPALYLAYDRCAYFGVGQHDLRVSFDTNIRTRRQDLRLEAGDHGKQLLESGQWLMEIKVARSIPVWLCRLLSEYGIYRTSFSKYGTEYKSCLAAKHPAYAGLAKAPERAGALTPALAR